MRRNFHLLLIGSGLAEHLQRAPANWRLDLAEMDEARRWLHGLAGIDALVLDWQGSAGELDLLQRAREWDSTLPVIAVLPPGRPALHRLGRASEADSEPLAAQPDLLLEREALASGKLDLVNEIAATLRRGGRVENRQAILITHGTDTMAWAFAYLRYALSGLAANVALTGSQLPLEGTFSLSDALGNLRTSVHLLNRLAPGKLFLVFNEGRHIYSGSLNKIRKWDQNAFDGRLAGAIGAEWVDFFDRDWTSIAYPDQKLELLHLLRTGGTIESAPGQQGSLEPNADFVQKYLRESLSSQFETLVDHPELGVSRDSSNISLEEWQKLAGLTAELAGCACDTRFDPSVKVVYANPFMTAADYQRQFEACQHAVVLAGYGAGNANALLESGRSVVPAIRQAVADGKLVALSSQVPLESYDMDYQVGRELVQAGGLPCGDLSLADAQIKLSYLCGHRAEILAAAGRAGLSARQGLSTAFLAGVKLRKRASRRWLLEALTQQECPLRLVEQDPFEGLAFEAALRRLFATQ